MAKDDDLLDDQISDDDLLDFDLDDLTAEDIQEDLIIGESDDDEIIELVDLVEKGEEEFGGVSDSMEFSSEEQPAEGTGGIDLLSDDVSGLDRTATEEAISLTDDELDMSDLSLESDLDLGEEMGVLEEPDGFIEMEDRKAFGEQSPDMDFSLDVSVGDDESLKDLVSEKDLKAQPYEMFEISKELEGSDVDSEPEDILEKSDLDLSETVQAPIPDTQAEELYSEEEHKMPDLPAGSDNIMEQEAVEAPLAPLEAYSALPPEAVPAALSEEKIEAVIASTVAEIVERVARDTLTDVIERVTREAVSEVAERVVREAVSEVAERVITEAINALKQSLES
jgi:hypothetical protein